MATLSDLPMDPSGPTGKLCVWIDSLSMASIPEDVKTRAKFLLLDGVACALVGAHLPWSEKATNVMLDMDPAGDCLVFGWDKVSPTPHIFFQNITGSQVPETTTSLSSPHKQHLHPRLRAR